MRKTQNKKNGNKLGGLFVGKRFHIFILTALFGAAGLYLTFGARAAVSNPNFTCGGYDIAFAVDTSGSVGDMEAEYFKNVAKAFINNLGGTNTQFMVIDAKGEGAKGGGSSDSVVVLHSTSNAAAVISAIDGLPVGSGGDGNGTELFLLHGNPRPDKQDVYIFLNDGNPGVPGPMADNIKSKGIRMLSFSPKDPLEDYLASFGPRVDTQNVLTSDIITEESDYNTMAAQLGTFLRGCNPQPPPPPCTVNCDPGGGNDGNDNGNNNSGNGNNGTGNNGGGGGGSSATNQGDADNATPSNSDQGDSDKQPKVEPSPFFDGKLFALGSSAEAGTGNTVGVGGLRVGYGWFYLLGLLVLLGVGGWFGWKKWGAKLKTKLRM